MTSPWCDSKKDAAIGFDIYIPIDIRKYPPFEITHLDASSIVERDRLSQSNPEGGIKVESGYNGREELS